MNCSFWHSDENVNLFPLNANLNLYFIKMEGLVMKYRTQLHIFVIVKQTALRCSKTNSNVPREFFFKSIN